MRFTIYQLPHNNLNLFEGYDETKTINMGDYVRVWKGNIEIDATSEYEVLERLFYIFNQARPVNFAGHSLSVSDVVELEHKLYYCDSLGWKEIKEWC